MSMILHRSDSHSRSHLAGRFANRQRSVWRPDARCTRANGHLNGRWDASNSILPGTIRAGPEEAFVHAGGSIGCATEGGLIGASGCLSAAAAGRSPCQHRGEILADLAPWLITTPTQKSRHSAHHILLRVSILDTCHPASSICLGRDPAYRDRDSDGP